MANTISILITAKDQASATLKATSAAVQSSADEMNAASVAANGLSEATTGILTPTQQMSAELQIAKQRLAEAQEAGDASASSMMGLELAVGKAETALNDATGSAAKFTAAAADMKKAGDGMSSIGTVMSIGLTLPIAAAGAAAVVMAGNFEQSLNILQSVSDATTTQMADLRTEAVALGNDITLPGVSAAGAAQAMTELAKAGLSVNDVMTASHGVLALATAGQIDVQDAADTTARALNAFGLSGDQANKIADLLAASANASTASVGDMALGLQMAGAQSHQMGVSLQDTVTALAEFSNAGINGSDAGTSLKQMFLQLANPTTAASALMKQLGLNFWDAKGNFIGLSDTAQLLQTKLKGLTQEQKNSALATIFGSDATRVAAILADGGATAFNNMSTAVNKQGAAADLAAAQNSGFKGALDNLVSTVQTGLIDVGTNLLPVLTRNLKSMGEEVGKLTAWFDGLSSGQQDLIAKTLLWTAVLGPAVLVTGKLVKTVGSAVSIVGALSKALGFFSTTKMVTQVGLATKALGSAGFAGAAVEGTEAVAGAGGLLAVLGPVAIGVAAVGIAAGGAYLLWKKFNDESDRYGASSGSGVGTRTAGAVGLVTLAQNNLSDATKAVQKANIDASNANTQQVDSQKQVKTATDDVTTAQKNVSDALDKYGAKSPQYQTAVANLATANDNLNQQLAANAIANLNVMTTSGQVTTALDNQKQATFDLNQLLEGTVTAIAKFGPTALNQTSSIDVLQGKITGLSISWDGFYTSVQSQNVDVNNMLFGTGSTISMVQSQSDKLNSTLTAAKSSAITIQSSVGSIQGSSKSIQGGHALGTQFAPTDSFLAGENGPEWITGAKGASVTPAPKTAQSMSSSRSVIIQNLNVNNNIDANAVIRKIGFKLATA